MSKLFSSIVFSFFLLFQTTSIAEEDSTPIETSVEEQEVQAEEVVEETESIEPQDEKEPEAVEEVQEEVEPEEALSEAEKEALAAEEAELREAGVYEEPVEE